MGAVAAANHFFGLFKTARVTENMNVTVVVSCSNGLVPETEHWVASELSSVDVGAVLRRMPDALDSPS
jgi:hypothetical protein